MNMLVIDVGGTNLKILATRQGEPRKFASGPTLTAERMVARVRFRLSPACSSFCPYEY